MWLEIKETNLGSFFVFNILYSHVWLAIYCTCLVTWLVNHLYI
jgi:hypothetical protein